MKIINEELSAPIRDTNEAIISVQPSLGIRETNTLYYPKLKYLMFNEITRFCKEKIDVRNDLLTLRTYIGEFLSEEEIQNILDGLKQKYSEVQDIGIEYHIEATRHDYGVCVFVIIKRGDIVYCKKFIYRFRKSVSTGLPFSGISAGGAPLPEKEIKQDIMTFGGE